MARGKGLLSGAERSGIMDDLRRMGRGELVDLLPRGLGEEHAGDIECAAALYREAIAVDANLLEARQLRRVRIDVLTQLGALIADILGIDEDRRDACTDQGRLERRVGDDDQRRLATAVRGTARN